MDGWSRQILKLQRTITVIVVGRQKEPGAKTFKGWHRGSISGYNQRGSGEQHSLMGFASEELGNFKEKREKLLEVIMSSNNDSLYLILNNFYIVPQWPCSLG